MLRSTIVIFAFLILYGCQPAPELEGEVKIKDQNDTLVVDYDLVYADHGLPVQLDSLFFRVPASDTGGMSDSMMFCRDSSNDLKAARDKVMWIDNRPRLSGQLRYPNYREKEEYYSFRMHESYTHSKMTRTSVSKPFRFQPFSSTPTWGITFSAGIVSYDRSVWPSNVRGVKDGVDVESEGGMVGRWQKWRGHFFFAIMGSVPHSDTAVDKDDSKSFAYFGLDIRREFNLPMNLRLSPFMGGEYSVFEIVYYPEIYKLENTGLLAGLQIGGKFDELSYSYHFNLDGYHQFDYKAYFLASPVGRMGTIYSFCHGDKVRMFRMRFYLEGIFDRHQPLKYYNDCNIIHNILAAGFLAPFEIIGALKGEKRRYIAGPVL